MKVEHSTLGEHEQTATAIWRRTSVRLLDETAIHAHFHFDSQGNLLRYELEEKFTGL